MLKVKGRNTSGNVMKVTWILEELGIPYQQEDELSEEQQIT